MLDHARIGRFPVRIVDYGVALIIGHILQFRFKADGPVFQRAQPVIEKRVDGAGEHHLFRKSVPGGAVFEIVLVQPHFHAFQHAGDHGGVSFYGNALIEGVEVVVVESEADGQPPDDESGQIAAVAPPLLFRISFYQFFKDILSHQADRLLLQVFRLRDACLPPLFLDFGRRLSRRHHAPHFVEGVHVEGQAVQFAVIVGYRRIGVAVESGEPAGPVPGPAAVGVKNMRPVRMHVNAFHGFGVDVSGDVGALFDHQHPLAPVRRLPGEHRAVQARADDQIIIGFHRFFPPLDELEAPGRKASCSSLYNEKADWERWILLFPIVDQ